MSGIRKTTEQSQDSFCSGKDREIGAVWETVFDVVSIGASAMEAVANPGNAWNWVKEFMGILNASPEKRYKNFISTVVDSEKVWLIENGDGYLTYDTEEYSRLNVWPTRECGKSNFKG